MISEKSEELNRLLFVLEMCITTLIFLLSYHLRSLYADVSDVDYLSHITLIPLVLALWSMSLYHFGAYRGLRARSMATYSWAVLRAVVLAMAMLFLLLFLLKVRNVSRLVMVTFAVANVIVLIGVRAGLVWWYFTKAVEKGENYLKVLIIGTGARALKLSILLHKHSEWGIDIIGHLDPDQERIGKTVNGVVVLGNIDHIGVILSDNVVDEVIVAVPRSKLNDVNSIATACEEEGVKLRFMADLFDCQFTRMKLDILDTIPLLTIEPIAHDDTQLLVKRLFDIIFTLLIMPFLLPLCAFIALAIKLDSKGPVFFVQERVGLKKRVFPMLKFRSMYVGSEEKIKELEHLNEAEGPIFKIANDPRVTRIGKILRKTSLDEFPQFFNVFKGQMSLVGPRPMSLRDVNLFDKGTQRKRFGVKPGLTCLWQVSGRSNLPFTKWLELDLEYIDNWSLWLDAKILLKTIPVVLKGSGAA